MNAGREMRKKTGRGKSINRKVEEDDEGDTDKRRRGGGRDLLRKLASSSQKSWLYVERGGSLSAKLHGEWEGTPAGAMGEHFPYKLGLDGILLKTHHPPLSCTRDPPRNPPFQWVGPQPPPPPPFLTMEMATFLSLLYLEGGFATSEHTQPLSIKEIEEYIYIYIFVGGTIFPHHY